MSIMTDGRCQLQRRSIQSVARGKQEDVLIQKTMRNLDMTMPSMCKDINTLATGQVVKHAIINP
ncbi:MAG: hypothetical protein EB149_04505 [Thaumarchaeota archaeon]|nr:hypothetical protein [Nitrososphaerota archaeon]